MLCVQLELKPGSGSDPARLPDRVISVETHKEGWSLPGVKSLPAKNVPWQAKVGSTTLHGLVQSFGGMATSLKKSEEKTNFFFFKTRFLGHRCCPAHGIGGCRVAEVICERRVTAVQK